MSSPGMWHNMSVPPRSQIFVEGARLPGRWFRFGVGEALWKHLEKVGKFEKERFKDDLESLKTVTGIFRLLSKLKLLTGSDIRRGKRILGDQVTGDPSRTRTEEGQRAAVTLCLAGALQRMRVPTWIGAIIEQRSSESLRLPMLDLPASLAVVCRRSGDLYLPSRRIEIDLVRDERGLLFFPDEDCCVGPDRGEEEGEEVCDE